MNERDWVNALTGFLLARIAEDEGAAHAAFGARVDLSDGIWTDPAAAQHMRRWDPARVLAECEAKRRIVERAACIENHGPAVDHVRALDMATGARAAVRDVLQLLSLPYADHPDYDESWRP